MKHLGVFVEQVRIPALGRDFALGVFSKLHVMQMKPALLSATIGRTSDKLYKMAKTMFAPPNTSMTEYFDAERAAERLIDCFTRMYLTEDAKEPFVDQLS